MPVLYSGNCGDVGRPGVLVQHIVPVAWREKLAKSPPFNNTPTFLMQRKRFPCASPTDLTTDSQTDTCVVSTLEYHPPPLPAHFLNAIRIYSILSTISLHNITI